MFLQVMTLHCCNDNIPTWFAVFVWLFLQSFVCSTWHTCCTGSWAHESEAITGDEPTVLPPVMTSCIGETAGFSTDAELPNMTGTEKRHYETTGSSKHLTKKERLSVSAIWPPFHPISSPATKHSSHSPLNYTHLNSCSACSDPQASGPKPPMR